MTECIIVFRNPKTRSVWVIEDGDTLFTDIAVFPNEEEAQRFVAESSLLQAWPYQIVELDDL